MACSRRPVIRGVAFTSLRHCSRGCFVHRPLPSRTSTRQVEKLHGRGAETGITPPGKVICADVCTGRRIRKNAVAACTGRRMAMPSQAGYKRETLMGKQDEKKPAWRGLACNRARGNLHSPCHRRARASHREAPIRRKARDTPADKFQDRIVSALSKVIKRSCNLFSARATTSFTCGPRTPFKCSLMRSSGNWNMYFAFSAIRSL